MTPQEAIDAIINPLLALHKGAINVEKVENNIVYITMRGGCQGCARAKSTIAQYVKKVITAKIPEITDVVDVTDHSQGTNPFYKENSPDETES